MSNPNPIIKDYLRILYKINDIYIRFDLDEKDLEDEINYYHNKDAYSEEEIKELQNKCESEWKEVLIKLCNGLIAKIASKGDYKKILKVELNQAKKIYQELTKEDKTLDEYEKLFDNKYNDLRNTLEREIAKYEIENKRYANAILLGIISTILIEIILYIFIFPLFRIRM